MKTETASQTKRPRGRPRSFDREQALDSAMEVFWEKGFEGASLADLTDAMGVNPPSLYSAFGDKESLFLEAVERYVSQRGESCDYCGAATAKDAVRMLLDYMAEDLTSSAHPRGCLMMMASTTTSAASPKLQAALSKLQGLSRTRLRERIQCGIAAGEMPADTDAAALTAFYNAVMTGMSVMAKDGATRKSLVATVETAMRAWPDAPAGAKKRKAATARA